MTDIDFRSTYESMPEGPVTWDRVPGLFSDKTLKYSSTNTKTIQNAFAIVANGGKSGGPCLRMTFPANVTGGQGPGSGDETQSRQIMVTMPPPQQVLTLEFDWLFEDGFDFREAPDSGGGKIGPKIMWGKHTGDQAGTSIMVTWRNPAKGWPTPPFVAYLQNQRTGQNIKTQDLPEGIKTNHWYHWKIQALGGPGGWAKFWCDDVMVLHWTGDMGPTTIDDQCEIDMSFFYGGGPGAAPPTDGYGRNDNIRVYTGETLPPNGGGGGGDTGPAGPMTFDVTGTLTLIPRP